MNFKTTIALFILLAVVGGYFYFVEFGNMTGYEAHQQQLGNESDGAAGEPVFTDESLTAEAIDRIELTRGGRIFTAEKQGGDWFQTQPVRFPLDSHTPNTVAQQFVGLRYVQSIEPVETEAQPDAPSTAQMGLDKPRAVITVEIGDKSWALKLGRLAVDGHGYAQVEGEDTAYVVEPAIFGTLLDQQTNDWRKKSLGTFDAAGSDRITLHQREGDQIDLHKLDGTWWFDTETVQRTSEEAVEDLFSDVGSVWVSEFIEDNPDNLNLYGLDAPHLELVIQTPAPPAAADQTASSGEKLHRLKIGRTDLEGKSRYATFAGDDGPAMVVFTIDAVAADRLTRTMDELRDPRVVTVDPQDVRGLTVSQSGETTLNILRNPQSGYSFGEPRPSFTIDYSTTHALVRRLCELESTTYNTSLNDLSNLAAKVTLSTATGDGTKLTIYQTGESYTFVTEGEGVGYVVEANDLVQQLTGPSLNLRKRTVLDIAAEELTGISLRHPDGARYEFTPGADGEGWTLANHPVFEDTTLDSLIAGLNPLRSENWLADPVSPSAGWVELTLTMKDGTTSTLMADPTSRQAMLTGTDSGFVLPQAFLDLLTAEYRERSLHMPGVDQIESIRLSSGPIEVTLTREGQRFKTDQGEIDQAIAAGTFDTFAGLRVHRYTAPLHVIPEMFDFTLIATKRDGETVTLSVLTGDDPDVVTATINPDPGADHTGWFTLSRSDVQALRTPLTDLESPTK